MDYLVVTGSADFMSGEAAAPTVPLCPVRPTFNDKTPGDLRRGPGVLKCDRQERYASAVYYARERITL